MKKKRILCPSKRLNPLFTPCSPSSQCNPSKKYPSRSVFFVMTEQEPFSVKVTVMDGNSFVTSCRSTDTVSMLKAKIADVSSIPVEHQRVIFRGRVLHDEETLGECNVERDCVVFVVKQSVGVLVNGKTKSPTPRNEPASSAAETTSQPPQVVLRSACYVVEHLANEFDQWNCESDSPGDYIDHWSRNADNSATYRLSLDFMGRTCSAACSRSTRRCRSFHTSKRRVGKSHHDTNPVTF